MKQAPPFWQKPEFAFPALLSVYLGFVIALSNEPFQDLPNHLTRAHILADLLFRGGGEFGGNFSFAPGFFPYLGGDLILAGLDAFLGPQWAGRVWIALSVVLLPCSLWFALRGLGASPVAAATGGIFGLYLATNLFFIMGFTNNQLAMACAFFAYGWLAKAKATQGVLAYGAFCVALLIGYFMHLSALIFVIAMSGISLALAVWKRELSVRSAALMLSFPCAMLALYVALGRNGAAQTFPTNWGNAYTKMRGVFSPFHRFDRGIELSLLAAYLAAILFPVRSEVAALRTTRAEQMLIACVFAALYLVLPVESGGAYGVDARAIPYALAFLGFCGTLSAEKSSSLQRRQLVAASVLACINVVTLGAYLLPANTAMDDYKLVAGAAPGGAHILPIDSRPAIGQYQPFAHAGSYATLQTAALTPYLFAGDQVPHMGYFRYRRRDAAPPMFWYTETSGSVNWQEIGRDYQYLLITTPWDPGLIPLQVRIVKQNGAAALLQILPP